MTVRTDIGWSATTVVAAIQTECKAYHHSAQPRQDAQCKAAPAAWGFPAPGRFCDQVCMQTDFGRGAIRNTQALRIAARASRRQVSHYRSVKSILSCGLDRQDSSLLGGAAAPMPEHDNVRGPGYYWHH